MTTELQLVKSEKFGDVQADIYSNSEDMYMTINQLSECLGYASTAGVKNIIMRNDYLNSSEFSTSHNLCQVEGNRTVTRNIRLFNEDGIYEITFLAKTKVAKSFRSWVRTVLKRLRNGEMQLSSQSISFAPQVIEIKMQQLLNYTEQMMKENQELKSDVSFIKSQMLKITPAPRFTDWKKDVNYKIKVLAEIGQITKNTFLHNVYVKFTEMGYNLNKMKQQYCDDNGIVNCSTLDFIENNDVLREKFDFFLNNMGAQVNKQMEQMAAERESEIQELPYIDPIKSAINPLIEKLNDKSHGGNLTYRKVYTAMNVGWANRQTRYKKLHNLKNPPKKITLVENDEKLTKLFVKTVNAMLAE